MSEHPQYADALALYAMNALDDPRELRELVFDAGLPHGAGLSYDRLEDLLGELLLA